MNRKRTVTAASGISAVLVAGSSAFAVTNGIFVARPAARAGQVGATQVRLVPNTPRLGARRSYAAPQTLPRAATAAASLPTAAPPTFAAPMVTMPLTTSPPTVTRATSPTVARSGPSVVAARHSDDEGEMREDDGSDD